MINYITIREIAKRLDVSIQTVAALIKTKRITATRKDGMNANSTWLVDRKSFCTYLSNRISAYEAKAASLKKVLIETEK